MLRTPLWCGILIVMIASSAAAQNDFSCGPRKLTKLAMTTPTAIYLKCNSPWPDTSAVPGRFEVWVFPDDWKADPTKGPQQYTSGSIVNWTQLPAFYLELNLGQPIQANKKYILILRKAATPAVIDLYIEFSTEGKGPAANEAKGEMKPSGASAELGRIFVVTSSSNASASVTVSPATAARQTFTVPTAIALASTPPLDLIEKRDPITVIPHDIDNNGSYGSQANPEETGSVTATLSGGKKLRQPRATVGVAPKTGQLTNILQQQVKAGEAIDLQPTPVGKDDALTYLQFSHVAGVGSKPAYAINIKEKTFLFLDRDLYVGDYLIQPDILVDVATNSLAKKTDDTIKIGFTATKTTLTDDYKKFFQGIRFGPGVTYETNRGFHKNNLLFTFDTNPLLNGLYQSREVRRYQAAADQEKTSVADIPESQYKWGGGLEFFFGLEAGGALSDQTFQNKKKTASLNVPQYSIFRFRPKVHAFVEYDRFSLDWSGTLRGLLTPEYVGEELPDGTIRLRRISAWQAYSELTAAYILDPSKHIAFTVTYKRGAQPPSYPHVRTVSTGLTLKY